MTVPALVAFAATLALIVPVMRLSARTGSVSRPRSDRWGARPVPRIGGLAIVAALAAGTLLVPLATFDRVLLLVGMGIIAAVGLADDLGTVSPSWRLAIEGLVGGVAAGAMWSGLGWGFAVIAAVTAAIGVPLAANATNLVDNADGLAASLSAVTGGALAVFATILGSGELAAASLVATAACLAFLVFNLPPAKVYMGDVGSLGLGFFLAALTALVAREAVATEPLRLDILLAIPVAWALQMGDLLMVLVSRVRRGASPLRGGVDHTSHRLMRAGLTPRKMLAVIIGSAAACVAIVSIGLLSGSAALTAILLLMILLSVLVAETALAARVPHE